MRIGTPRLPSPILAATLSLIGSAALLIGCGSSTTATTQTTAPTGPTTFAGATFGGKAMAGLQPLISASVQVYAAGTAGDGLGATALLATPLTTGSSGSFSVPAGYTCPTSASQVYIVARGGMAGASASAANSAIVFLAALGACNQIVASSQIVVDEVTTVAAACALAQFLAAGANIGAASTNATGLKNAFATAAALGNNATGLSPGAAFAANGTSPAARIDSLANLLNACAASTSSSSTCASLFSLTTPSGSTASTNTLDAVLDLARNPALNVAALFTASALSSAFSPVLAAAPSDWTLFVNYTGGGMNGPAGLGIDGSGNVWVSSYFNVASLFSPLGVPLFANGITGGGLSASYGLAVDANNNAWIPNQPGYAPNGSYISGNSVSVFNESGQSVAGTGGFTGSGLYYPTSVSIDTDGSAWLADYGDSYVTHLSSSGQALSGTSGYTSTEFSLPVAGAIDGSHNYWVANQAGTSITKISSDGSQFTNYVCCDGPVGVAIDQKGNVWATSYTGNYVTEITSAGAISPPFSASSFDHPQNVAIDGAGNVWVTNFRGNSITELAGASSSNPGTPLSPTAGWGVDAGLQEDFPIAVDASGNLWVANFATSTLTQFVGLATPVKTPLIALPAAP